MQLRFRNNQGHDLRMLANHRKTDGNKTTPGRGVLHRNLGNDKPGVISGLAAVYFRAEDPGTEFWLWSDMVERIHPGAFDRVISEEHDVRGVFNHDGNQLLGRVSSGSCRLSLDAAGLNYEIDVDPNDADHARVCAKIDRGDVTGSSFAFVPKRVVWEDYYDDEREKWIYVRNIHDMDVYDVCPVTWPAYEATAAGRSDETRISNGDAARAELIAERDAQLAKRWDDEISVRRRMIELEQAG